MKFQVTFKSVEDYSLDLPSKELGFPDLEKTEISLHIQYDKGHSLDLVHAVDALRENLTISLTREMAKELHKDFGLFKTCNLESVKVPKSHLNKYGKLELFHTVPADRQLHKFAHYAYSVDRAKIISDWIADEAPLQWGFKSAHSVVMRG